MVESSNKALVRLQKSDFDTNTILGFQPDYYECPVCMSIPTASKILECPLCKQRACQDCLRGYTRS